MKNITTTPVPIIILVEDEDALRRSITFTLLRMGYCVLPYGSVDEALPMIGERELRSQRIILVITDLQLPGKNGLELVRTARIMLPKVPTLVITGHGSREVREKLQALGVGNILDKPFDLDELVTMVQKMLAGSAIL